jgi:hypothetical protein
LQGDDALGTRDLAFHARLMELALQAGNAAEPQTHGDRQLAKKGNEGGPESGMSRHLRRWSTLDSCKLATLPLRLLSRCMAPRKLVALKRDDIAVDDPSFSVEFDFAGAALVFHHGVISRLLTGITASSFAM